MQFVDGGASRWEWEGPVVVGDGGEWRVETPHGTADLRFHGAVVPSRARGERIDLNRPVQSRVGRRRQPDPSGRLTALRPAVPTTDAPGPIELMVQLPDVTRAAGGFPLATVATACITAAVAALFFSPIFALLAGVSAVAVIGRWVGSIVAHRRSAKRRVEAERVALGAWADAKVAWAEAQIAARYRGSLSPDEISATIDDETSPWWERLDVGQPFVLTLGLGALSVEVPLGEAKSLEQLVPPRDRQIVLDPVPVDVVLSPGLAVCGDRSDALGAVRWLVRSALTRIGPADLGVVVVTTSDRVADWDQIKWSPALAACVVVDHDRDDALSDALDRAGHGGAVERRPVWVIVDGAEPTGSGLLARVLSGRVDGVTLLWMGASEGVPAGCRSSVSVAADGQGSLHHLDRSRDAVQELRWFGSSETEWSETMRWLARFDDAECVREGQGLVASAALVDLVAPSSVGEIHVERRFAASLERRWALASTKQLIAPIGLDQEGPVEIDLVSDGPHMLAAGTTGAGKSELLRTLVVGLASEQPPDVVSFVLVDFKGGGAFDLVAPLPHVAAVVTDLDPLEAGRALRGLRAEILDREHRLRDMEVSDVSDIDRLHPRAFGRMVVIVDEFAALADELPEFLDGLVDIARRGRSLGVHLVLATQRPAGVVTGQIRANTNLRLCLRVQDRSDSVDVIDDPMAGLLPPIPGRAVLRRGGSRCQQLQVAQVSGERHRLSAEPFRLHPAVPVTAAEKDVAQAVSQALDAIGSDDPPSASLVERIVEASRDTPRAAAPWAAAPLRASFPVHFEDGAGDDVVAGNGGAVLGLLDDPDRRRISPLEWQPDADGLLVIGTDEEQIAETASTAIAAALDRDRSRAVFILDGDRNGSAPLARLAVLDPVIDIIGVAEPERLLRAVEQLGRTKDPRTVVIHNWSAVADVLVDVAGPLGAERLAKLVRRAGTAGTSIVVTARSERDVPQRAAGALGRRLVHRLADPAGFLSFGLRPAELGALDGAGVVEPVSGLIGVVAKLDQLAIHALAERVKAHGGERWPLPVRVLGARVDRSVLPAAEPVLEGWRVPVGLDIDLAPHWIVVAPQRPVVVLAHPGGGRTTALTTISAELGERACVIDNADTFDNAALVELIAAADREGQAVVVSCTPGHAKRFGSAVAELLQRSTVVLLNPGRNEGELVRLALPDLTDEPVGRAVSVDRGRATIVQIAA